MHEQNKENDGSNLKPSVKQPGLTSLKARNRSRRSGWDQATELPLEVTAESQSAGGYLQKNAKVIELDTEPPMPRSGQGIELTASDEQPAEDWEYEELEQQLRETKDQKTSLIRANQELTREGQALRRQNQSLLRSKG